MHFGGSVSPLLENSIIIVSEKVGDVKENMQFRPNFCFNIFTFSSQDYPQISISKIIKGIEGEKSTFKRSFMWFSKGIKKIFQGVIHRDMHKILSTLSYPQAVNNLWIKVNCYMDRLCTSCANVDKSGIKSRGLTFPQFCPLIHMSFHIPC